MDTKKAAKRKFTFDDWLNDRIPHNQDELGLILSKEEMTKITAAREKAYDHALNTSLETMQKVIINQLERIKNNEGKERYIRRENERIEKILNENPRTEQDVLTGRKNLKHIGPRLYNKLLTMQPRSGQMLDDNYFVRLNYELYNWLKTFTLTSGELTHRQNAIIEYFKGTLPNPAKEGKTWKEVTGGNKNREKAIRSLDEKSSYYKSITPEEINSIIPFLKDFPEALKRAKEHLNKSL